MRKAAIRKGSRCSTLNKGTCRNHRQLPPSRHPRSFPKLCQCLAHIARSKIMAPIVLSIFQRGRFARRFSRAPGMHAALFHCLTDSSCGKCLTATLRKACSFCSEIANSTLTGLVFSSRGNGKSCFPFLLYLPFVPRLTSPVMIHCIKRGQTAWNKQPARLPTFLSQNQTHTNNKSPLSPRLDATSPSSARPMPSFTP